jgi:2-polyprenyl-6-methoxyphenol hydroxylase-like FAD-dependent oxidoreductase
MRALIVGGSLGGLMSGIELRAAGVVVSIHERSDRVLDDRGAGIVMQPGTLGILTVRCGLKEKNRGMAAISPVSQKGWRDSNFIKPCLN